MPSGWNKGKKILHAFIGTLFNRDNPDIDGYHYYTEVKDSGIYFGLQHNSKIGEPNMHQHIHVFKDWNTGNWTWQLTCRDPKHQGSVAGHGHDEYGQRYGIDFLNNDTGDVEILIQMIRGGRDPFKESWAQRQEDFHELITMVWRWKTALNKCFSSWLGRGMGRTDSGNHWLESRRHPEGGWVWTNGRGDVMEPPRFWQNTVDYDIDEFLSQALGTMDIGDEGKGSASLERVSEPTVAQRQPVECRFGRRCRRLDCHFEHHDGRFIDTPCRYGQGCTNPGCHFGPPGHGVSQLPFMGGGNRKTRSNRRSKIRRKSKTRRRSNIRRKKRTLRKTMTRRRSNTRRRSMKKKRNTMKRTRL